MYPLLAQLDPNLLSLTGVIATILAVIFAIAAYNNSRTRKKHMKELDRQQKQEHALHFRPARSRYPGRSSLPHQSSQSGGGRSPSSSQPAPRAAPVAKPEPQKEADPEAAKPDSKESSADSAPLFRKVRPSGLGGDLEEDPSRDGKNEYVWE